MSPHSLPTAVAVVHEWLVSRAGSEKVVEQVLAVCPGADLFSLVEFLPPEARSLLPPSTTVRTSFIQNLPWARRHFRQYLPLMPLAVEQFDLSAYDLVISSNHAVAKGVITRPHQLHVSYVHTPIRYAWDLQQQYLQQAGLTSGLKSALTRLILHYLRLWDLAAAHRVDCFVANSHYVARRIGKTYRRPATVIYPPVAIDRFRWDRPRDDFYLTVSRCVPYKRVDITVAAFNRLGLPLVVIGDGPALGELRRLAQPHITFLQNPTDAVVSDHMERCRGFVFPAEEDFGITVVEAQAAGAAVIAYGRGGCAETVIDGKTGLLFQRQTAADLVQAIEHFEQHRRQFVPETSRLQAETFSADRFRHTFAEYLAHRWLQFKQGDRLE